MEESYFTLRIVLPRGKTEATCSEALSEVFEECQDHEIKPVWISHDDVLELSPVKQDVFVLDPFEGEAFSFLSRFKCTVVGPRCLLSCLSDSVPVPELPYPMYTATLRGCVVTSTGFERERKARLQLQVERMGGIYANAFHDGVTHLVAEVVKSPKYDVAIRKEVPIFTEEWLEKLWEVGKHENIRAEDKRFLRYACPALKGLVICVSQMARRDKDTLRKKIEAHGGVYSPVLDMEKTAILITATTNGDKYEYARKWQIPCVIPEWVLDSIDQGYCLPTAQYRVDAARASTPTKGETSKAEGKLEEVSMCSVIVRPGVKGGPTDETMTRKVDESAVSTTGNLSLIGVVANKGISSDEELLDKLEKREKKGGLFLDECVIFTSGFTETQSNRLDKVLRSAGANRMNQITPSLTHMIVGGQERETREEHLEMLGKLGSTPYRVTLQWVVESMQLGRPAAEEDCLFVPDSVSKRASKTLSTSATLMEQDQVKLPSEVEQQENYENDLLLQYKKSRNSSSSDTCNADDTVQFKKLSVGNPGERSRGDNPEWTVNQDGGESQVSRFLTDRKLALVGFQEEAESELGEWVSEAGGEFVFRDFKGILDYLVVPVDVDEGEVVKKSGFKARQVVTDFWLEDCLDAGALLPVEYFHKPIRADRSLQPCSGAVIGITNYVGRERQFVAKLAEVLGAVAQEIFAKREKRGAKQSTHLVCARAEGAKYEAALKWGLPVTTKDWLLSCAAEGQWVCERTFLVGDANAFTKGRPEPSKAIEDDEGNADTIVVEDSSKKDKKIRESVVKTPRENSAAEKQERQTLPNLETPRLESIDIEKLRPSRVQDLRRSSVGSRHDRLESQPSPSQQTLKRKRQDGDDGLPFYLDGVKTPETPYGAFLGGGDPTPKTRKVWKRHCDDLAQFEMTAEQRVEVEKEAEDMKRTKEEKEKKEEEEKERLRRAFQEHEENFLNPERARREHEAEIKRLGVAVPGDGKTFDDLMEEKFKRAGKSWKNQKRRSSSEANTEDSAKSSRRKTPVYNKDVMKGVIVCVARKLRSVQDELNAIVASLGGEFRHQYGPEVTHYIFSSVRSNDVTKEFRLARKDGKKVVCPDWVYMSRDEGRLVEEDAFPHTFNPRMNLSISVSAGGSSPNTRRATTRKKETLGPIDETANVTISLPLSKKAEKSFSVEKKVTNKPSPDVDKEKREGQSDDATTGTEELQHVSAQLAKLDELSSSARRRSSGVRLALQSADGEDQEDEAEEKGKIFVCEDHPSQTPEGVSQAIQWKDPDEEEEMKILQQRLAMETQAMANATESEGRGDVAAHGQTFQSMEIPDNLTAVMEEDKENGDKQKTSTDDNEPPRCFMMSSVPDKERQKFVAFLESQGVAHSTVNSCDPKATHIIAQKLSRSEKMLGSIASGKWVLHPSFMPACLDAGRVVSEDRFEWGNPENEFVVPGSEMTDLERKLAAASFRWRKKRTSVAASKSHAGAFSGFRAIIHTSKSRVDAFKRLIELGGGKVLKVHPPFSNPDGATHLLAEPSRCSGVKIDYRSLAAASVAVVSPVYINEFLVADPPPKVDRFIVDEFKNHWANRNKT